MIFGITLTALTFTILILSIVSYYLYHLRKEELMLKIARNGFYTASGLIVVQAAILMYGILNHYFEWIYVFSYSSRDLSTYYLVSTFWAGQEGTFLLWLLFGSAYGIFIIHSRKDDEPLVMSFMSLVQAFIVLILVKKSPFAYVWDVNPVGFQAGVVPVDGNGLNPLLQDPWMVIHPPILFSGYSSTMILFSFAMAALVRKQHDEWIKSVYPFTLFVAMALGTGIILGGYWAYTTLGWGGYWGWDPVENSSFVPWLVSLALFHGILIQRRQGGMKRMNLFLAIAAFVLVLYGSFLTRSGVLTDFSVHSFGESELSVYLVAFLFLFTGIGFITYAFRVQGVKGNNLNTGFFTRELFIAFGMMFILLLAVFTFIGTSWPLISGLLLDKANAIDVNAYNTIGGPIAIFLGLLIALAPVFSWKRDNFEKIKSVSIHFVISIFATGLMFWGGIRDLIPLLISGAAVLILLVNGEIVYRMIRQKTYAFGGYLAHVGIGLMLIGIITSSVYDVSNKITLPLHQDTSIMGYNIRYNGKQNSPDGKDRVLLTINQSRETYAKFYWSEYNRSYMVAPSVVNTFLEDLYISPIQIIEGNDERMSDVVNLKKKEIVQYGNTKLRFVDYDMGNHGNNMGTEMKIVANIEVLDSYDNVVSVIHPGLKMVGQNREDILAELPGTGQSVKIDGLSVEDQMIVISVGNATEIKNVSQKSNEMLAVEVSRKPLINVLWMGTIVLVMGFVTTIYNRTKRQKL
ncbi:MAG: heme lyase CcmF/NrfE family subunit [Calditrichae bacterium]|nr:heme lyase CcmF/NrfE family subunit [Calditrichota bacterium]MCB9059084.1 heme lyase CcmF/NrfE family subunit [Calditrichia bacterium]